MGRGVSVLNEKNIALNSMVSIKKNGLRYRNIKTKIKVFSTMEKLKSRKEV